MREAHRILLAACLLLFSCTFNASKKIALVENGKIRHVIYVDPQAPASVHDAANELKRCLTKATGAVPQIVVANQAPAGPYISLGNTVAAKTEGLDADSIGNDGFRIVTINDNLYIIGPDTPENNVTEFGGVKNGTANGVYTFLEDYLGVRWLFPGELGEEIPAISSLDISPIDRTETPLFVLRNETYIGTGEEVSEWKKYMKLGGISDLRYDHAWAETIPATLFDEHPAWFAEVDGKPKRPTTDRFKLETTNPELVQAYADVVIESFRNNPNLRSYSLSPTDGGGDSWSNSAASMALTEKSPYGNISRTPLILKFYNDVAKIVGKEFPNHKLGGYIYSNYRFPPIAGVPELEPNLSLMLANGEAYGFKLFRTKSQNRCDSLMYRWSESARKDGFDLYYYDLPTWVRQYSKETINENLITPPAPELLHFDFSRMAKYGYKGGDIYGHVDWPAYGPGNYLIAKLFWNPTLTMNQLQGLLQDYFQTAYGEKAAPHIAQLYTSLESAFRAFYNRYPAAKYEFSQEHWQEIYGPLYPEIEKHYLKALDVVQEPRQKQRLELLGKVIARMQGTLRLKGLLASNFESSITPVYDQKSKDYARPLEAVPGGDMPAD